MEQRPVSLCSFCGNLDQRGFASSLDSSQICQQCACNMEEIVRRSGASGPAASGVERAKQVFEEWMLLVFPITIVAVATSMQPESLRRPWAPLLQGFGVVFVVGALFYELWQVIRRRPWLPGVFVPIAWLGCGAYIGSSLGLYGMVGGAISGFATWLLSRYLIRRTKILGILEKVVLPQRPH